jgi:DNA-binding transcriptional ArsR family regulator
VTDRSNSHATGILATSTAFAVGNAAREVCHLGQPNHGARSSLARRRGALSDATRRGVLEQLGRSDASITELADKFHMTLTGMKKHVGVLERAGVVATEKIGRVRTCTLGPRRLTEETAWIDGYRQLWSARFDELDAIVEELKRKERIFVPEAATASCSTSTARRRWRSSARTSR